MENYKYCNTLVVAYVCHLMPSVHLGFSIWLCVTKTILPWHFQSNYAGNYWTRVAADSHLYIITWPKRNVLLCTSAKLSKINYIRVTSWGTPCHPTWIIINLLNAFGGAQWDEMLPSFIEFLKILRVTAIKISGHAFLYNNILQDILEVKAICRFHTKIFLFLAIDQTLPEPFSWISF